MSKSRSTSIRSYFCDKSRSVKTQYRAASQVQKTCRDTHQMSLCSDFRDALASTINSLPPPDF